MSSIYYQKNTSLYKLAGAILALFFSAPLIAAEASPTSVTVTVGVVLDGAGEAIAAGEKLKAPAISIRSDGFDLRAMLDKDLAALGVYAGGWNAEKERYVAITEVELPIKDTRATVSNIVPLINQANIVLGLRAMQNFSQWLGSTASLDVNLSVGTSSPVGELFEQHQQRFRSEMDGLIDLLRIEMQELQQHRTAIVASASLDEAAKREVDEKIAEMTQAIDILNREASGNPATLTRMNRALDAVQKKLDPSYDPAAAASAAHSKAIEMQAKLDATKASRDSTISAAGQLARERVAVIKEKIKTLQKQVTAKEAEAKKFFSEYQQDRQTTKFNWSADYNVVGLIPIKYYYGIVPGKNGKLLVKVAAAYAWSPATHREIRALITNDGLGTKVPEAKSVFSSYQKVLKNGNLPVEEWVRTQDPLTFGPSRWYIDDKGEYYMLSSAIVVKGEGSKASRSYSEVLARSKLALMMSLDVQYKETGSVADELIYDENDSRVAAKIENALGAKANSTLSNDEVWAGADLTMTLQDGGDSESIRYRIIKISARSIRDSYHAILLQAEAAAQAKRASARSEGSRQAARDHVKAAEARAPADRAEGYAKARSDLAPKAPPAEANSATNKSAPVGSVEVSVGPASDKSKALVKPVIKKDKTTIPDF
jgi:hypothetical protein